MGRSGCSRPWPGPSQPVLEAAFREAAFLPVMFARLGLRPCLPRGWDSGRWPRGQKPPLPLQPPVQPLQGAPFPRPVLVLLKLGTALWEPGAAPEGSGHQPCQALPGAGSQATTRSAWDPEALHGPAGLGGAG